MTNEIEALGQIRKQGLALLVVAVLVGGLGGAAIERIRLARRAPPSPGMFGAGAARPPGGLPPAPLDRLDLTTEQRRQIEIILERARPRTDSIMRAMMPRLRAITESTQAEIRTLLRPDQRLTLDSLERLRRSRRGRRGFGPGGPGGRNGPGDARRPPPGGSTTPRPRTPEPPR